MRKSNTKAGGLASEKEVATRLQEIDSRTLLTDLSEDDLKKAVDASSNKVPARPQRRFGLHPADSPRLPL